VSKGKLYSTLVLNLLLYGSENWVLTAPLRQRLNTFHNRCVRAMARPQRTSFPSTYNHPAPFVKRPALAQMYTALCLTSLSQVISNRKLRWAGHMRRMDWSRLPRKFRTSWVGAPRWRGRAHYYGHDLTRELQMIGFNTDRAAVQLDVSLSWGAAAQDEEEWLKLAARPPLASVETKSISNKRGRKGLSLSMLSQRPIQMPPPGRNDCGPGGRRGTIPIRTMCMRLITMYLCAKTGRPDPSGLAAFNARVEPVQTPCIDCTRGTDLVATMGQGDKPPAGGRRDVPPFSRP
jgi:hypothetical protein